MRKKITTCLFLMCFIVTGVSFGGCSSKKENSSVNASSVSKAKSQKPVNSTVNSIEPAAQGNTSQPRPAPESGQSTGGQSLYNSSAMPTEQPQGYYYDHGFTDEKILELSNEAVRRSENPPE